MGGVPGKAVQADPWLESIQSSNFVCEKKRINSAFNLKKTVVSELAPLQADPSLKASSFQTLFVKKKD